jgi:hypothetical protein
VLPRNNVKIFSSIEKLWDYCLLCPLCKNPERHLELTVGPDEHFEIKEWKKIAAQLQIDCDFRYDREDKNSPAGSYTASYLVDCQQNSYKMLAAGPDQVIADKATEVEFFFYIFAECKACNYSYLNTSDLEFNNVEKIISNIQLDRESLCLSQDENKYRIILAHDANDMLVVPYKKKGLHLPLTDLDLSNPGKVIEKLKLWILFS